MSKVLVTMCKDWADEFDVKGFGVFDLEDWNTTKEKFKSASTYRGAWFGTNEGWEAEEVEESKEYWLDDYTELLISDAEAEVLLKLFGARGFGTFINPISLIGG